MLICFVVYCSYNLSKTSFTNYFENFITVTDMIMNNLQRKIKKIFRKTFFFDDIVYRVEIVLKTLKYCCTVEKGIFFSFQTTKKKQVSFYKSWNFCLALIRRCNVYFIFNADKVFNNINAPLNILFLIFNMKLNYLPYYSSHCHHHIHNLMLLLLFHLFYMTLNPDTIFLDIFQFPVFHILSIGCHSVLMLLKKL